jgi:hypothetical protein
VPDGGLILPAARRLRIGTCVGVHGLSIMLDLIAVCLLAFDCLLALYLVHIEVNDPWRRLQRVHARREALRRQEEEARKADRDTLPPQ